MSKDINQANRRISQHELECEKRYAEIIQMHQQLSSKIIQMSQRFWFAIFILGIVGLNETSLVWKVITILAKIG